MDDRQTKIKAGAGLEESRLNQDFIDFLRKWSSPVLWLIVLIGAAWWGLRYVKEQRIARVDAAFTTLGTATSGGNPSVASLRTIATDYEGVRAVSELAMLQGADICLRAAAAGVEPGSEMDSTTGLPVNESDLLDEAGVTRYLTEARDLSRAVVEATRDDAGKALLGVQAFVRLGAAQEGLGSVDEAKRSYESAADLAEQHGFGALAFFARGRSESAGAGLTIDALPSQASLVPLPGEEIDEPEGDASTDPALVTDPAQATDPAQTTEPIDPTVADDQGDSVDPTDPVDPAP